ncbi:MAG: hypothetical protein K6G85_06830, partial [Eubacterium sp.]|nr:hypothetical protein [Eubacterium sp.]
GGSWYGMLIPWLISQCGSKTQQDTNVAEIQSLKLTSGNKLALSIDTTNYVMTIALQNSDGTVLDEKSIDFPLESVVVSGLYDAENKQVVLTLQNGSEIRFSVSDLVNGLVSEDQLTEGLDEKVDKVTGKGLSTNDFTNELKIKLDGIDLTNYVTNTDYPANNSSTGGVVKYGNKIYGIQNVSNGVIGIVPATDAEIEAQSTNWRVLTPKMLSKAIKEGLTNNSITLTSAEKQAARDWIDADGGTWEKLVDKTLESNSTIALNFSDFNFNGQYKKIKVQIRGQMQTANSNISFYRMNNSSAYQVFGQVGMTTDALYEFDLSESPYLQPPAIRDSSVELKVFNVSSNSWQQFFYGKAPVNQKMNETYELKVLGSSNFLANTRVVVWGIK